MLIDDAMMAWQWDARWTNDWSLCKCKTI